MVPVITILILSQTIQPFGPVRSFIIRLDIPFQPGIICAGTVPKDTLRRKLLGSLIASALGHHADQRLIVIVIKDEFLAIGREYTEDEVNRMAEMRVRKEVQRGIQTIQYQIQTLLTTNGQTPFVSIFMYLDEVEPGQTRDDLALIISETLKQRYEGIKNEVGVWVSPAFPKLIYVLDEDNITEDL